MNKTGSLGDEPQTGESRRRMKILLLLAGFPALHGTGAFYIMRALPGRFVGSFRFRCRRLHGLAGLFTIKTQGQGTGNSVQERGNVQKEI